MWRGHFLLIISQYFFLNLTAFKSSCIDWQNKKFYILLKPPQTITTYKGLEIGTVAILLMTMLCHSLSLMSLFFLTCSSLRWCCRICFRICLRVLCSLLLQLFIKNTSWPSNQRKEKGRLEPSWLSHYLSAQELQKVEWTSLHGTCPHSS